jgi:hypothetical protein
MISMVPAEWSSQPCCEASIEGISRGRSRNLGAKEQEVRGGEHDLESTTTTTTTTGGGGGGGHDDDGYKTSQHIPRFRRTRISSVIHDGHANYSCDCM